MVKETDDKLKKRICSHPLIKSRWHKWKLETIREAIKLPDPPSRVETDIRRGIQDIKELDVVTKQADKNLGMVLIRGDIYNATIREWLSEPAFIRVSQFPYDQIVKEVKSLVLHSEVLSPQRKWKICSTLKKCKEPCSFYAIPKIHKEKFGSRPITAQHSYILSGTSAVLADSLNEFVEEEETIGKDSKTTVARLEKLEFPDDCVFLTYDVESCYPSIDLDDAFTTFSKEMIHWSRVEDGIYLKLLKLVMKSNYVTANGKIYLQKIGTATGTQVAPPFANLYLYYKFKKVLEDDAILFQERFIDDGFIVTKSRLDAERIMKGLLEASSLNLTWNISDQEAIYLDLNIYKGPRFRNNKKVDLKVYFKPTNKLLYLPARSNHPDAMKTGIVRGEAIRTLRNTSDKVEWLKALAHIFKGLMARGYDPGMIKRQWKTVRFEDRETYINSSCIKERPRGLLIKTSYHHLTRYWWKIFTTKRPLEDVLKKKGKTWNKTQASLLKIWPPKIIWTDFKKIGNITISAKERWEGPKKRKLDERSKTGNSAKRLRSQEHIFGADPPLRNRELNTV